MQNIANSTMHNVIVDMIHESLESLQKNEPIDKDKIDILSGLVFEHIFHRTNTFVSDELNEFREHSPKLKKHQEYIEWSIPILNKSEKLIKKLKQISIIFSVLFTLVMVANQVYGVVQNYFNIDISVTQKKGIHLHKDYNSSKKKTGSLDEFSKKK